MLKWKKD